MATVLLNNAGTGSSQEGYISSITVMTNGSPTVLTPDANGFIYVTPQAANVLVGASRSGGAAYGDPLSLVAG